MELPTFLKDGKLTGLGTLSFLSVSDDPVRVCWDNHAIKTGFGLQNRSQQCVK